MLGAPLAEVADLACELIELFLQDAPEMMAALERSIASGDLDEARATAHRLKSACGNLGLHALRARCVELEALVPGGHLQGTHTALTAAYREAATALQQLRHELTAPGAPA